MTTRNSASQERRQDPISKYAPYYYYPGWWKGGMQMHLIVVEDEIRCAAEDLSGGAEGRGRRSANRSMLERYDADNPGALKRLVIGGA